MRRAFSRRAFLLTGAAAALSGVWRAVNFPCGRHLGAALPIGSHFNPEAEALVRDAAHFDALLLPAYAAAELIARAAVLPLTGPAGRAHDPEGAFTVPHSIVHYPITDALFSPRALWPHYGRLALAAALLHRGYPANDQHPGHVRQAAADLRDARPRFVRRPLTAREAGDGALVAVDAATAANAVGPTISLEYDWVIPCTSRQPAAAERLIRQHAARCQLPPAAITLTPLPAKARALYAEAWRSVR